VRRGGLISAERSLTSRLRVGFDHHRESISGRRCYRASTSKTEAVRTGLSLPSGTSEQPTAHFERIELRVGDVYRKLFRLLRSRSQSFGRPSVVKHFAGRRID
jgi:hypothetical protein